ncbi:MAG: hypothetical protein M1833_001702 [Piccolia ochrophora]|nr:MAG: hypothetical protein M1833_001702 [Piccolia ochrophora]
MESVKVMISYEKPSRLLKYANKPKGTVNNIILDPAYADLLAIVKAARNGAVYGAKVRFPHALVMVFLFRSGSLRSKLFLVLKATRQHARNLALFASLYKTLLLLLRSARPSGKEARADTFLAGLLGGYYVFGRGMQSSVNQQIVIYVFARVVLALAKLSVQGRDGRGGIGGGLQEMVKGEGRAGQGFAWAWPVFASLSWGGVMWIYRWHPDVVQPSLRSSMKYIYSNADHWDSFRNFLVHNT